MDQLVDGDARDAIVTKIREEAKRLREKGPEPEEAPTDDASVRSAASTDNPVPEPPFWGVREVPVDLDEVFPHLDLHVLFKLHWGGRGVKGEEWDELLRTEFHPTLERLWREQDFLEPRALLGYFPVASDGNDLIVFDPDDRERELDRLVFPRQPGHDRICLADFYRPLDSGERDVAAIQAVTAGPKVTETIGRLERDGEFTEQLYVHGLGVQVAEGSAEWLHAEVRSALGIGPAQGRRYSWGYPACPDQSEHEKVFRLLDAPSIGLSLSGGYAVEPEQSTLAIVAHHPQAIYFGMKSGRLSDKPSPDQIIADPEGRTGHRVVDGRVVFGEAPRDDEPEEGDMEPIDTRAAPQPSAGA